MGLSDTQLVTTLGLLVTTHYFVDCTISVYHYDLVCSLVLVSIATHIGPVAVMHRYYDSHWSLGLLRACLIIPSFVLAGLVFDRQRTSKIFPVYVPHSNVEGNSTGLVLPAACFQGHPSIHKTGNYKDFTSSDFWTTNQTTPSNINNASAAIASRQLSASNSTIPNDTMSVYSNFASDDNITDRWNIVVLACLIFAVIFAAAISFGQKMGDHSARTHRIAVGGKSLSVFICFAAALFGLVRFVKLRSWMQDSQWLRHDDGETDYKSFGQLLPMIMLALPFLAAFEQWVGELICILFIRGSWLLTFAVANEAPNTKAREYGDGQEMDPLTYNRT